MADPIGNIRSLEAQFLQQYKDNSSNSTSVVIGQGESKVTFSVNVSADGGGNQFSGKNPEQQKIALAKLMFGDTNPRAVALLEQLTDKLAAAGVKSADISVSIDGKIEITNLSKEENLNPKLLKNGGPNLAQFLAKNYGLDSERNKILMDIFKIASESRSEVVKMIIEAMEKNHQMWMTMLKELAVKINKDKQEQKVLLQRLNAKLAIGDNEGAKELVALLKLAGVSGVIPPAKEDSLVRKLGDTLGDMGKTVKVSGILEEFIKKEYEGKVGDELLMNSNGSQLLGQKVNNSSGKVSYFAMLSDINARNILGLQI